MTFSSQLHTATPTLGVIDPRGLHIRTVAYCRRVIAQPAEPRVTRQTFSLAGHLLACWDPRLWAQNSRANLLNVHSLAGLSLLSDSVDAGWQLRLLAQTGNPVCNWNGRGISQRITYDLLQRPVAMGETSSGAVEQIVERFDYAHADTQYAANNQCGQLIRHDDPAGTLLLNAYALTGAITWQTRHFLSALDSPDWPAAHFARNALLESGDGFSTGTGYNAAGQVLSQTDARGNLQQSAYTLAGQLKNLRLQSAGVPLAQTLVDAIRYNAWGQIESELAGNGVISQARYDPENGQLIALESSIPGQRALQALAYRYDPGGNLLSIEDRTLSTRYFRNQRIEPINHYHYDSLYQLIEARGWEASSSTYGPVSSPDQTQSSNYHQHYRYDAGGNLVELCHQGAQNYTRTFSVAPQSNRTLPVENSSIAPEFDSAFDASGNLAQLQPGQSLAWNLRNQLSLVNPVSREEAPDDSERYLYDASGNRLRKLRHNRTSSRSLLAEVRYLPGLELRSNSATGERLQVIRCTTGRNSVHMLHWEQGLPGDIGNNQMRYNLADHLGSASVELDAQGQLLSKEVYYPYGATAWWQDSSASQGRYKVRRYAGKERDATGLYYYGQRYYAPFLQRWINPDPAGYGDGLNLYCMVANSPLNFIDKQGTNKEEPLKPAADMFVEDIVNQIESDKIQPYGQGDFKELEWNQENQRFTSTGKTFKRGMEIVNQHSAWQHDTRTEIAIFRDTNNKLRLFATTSGLHMEIQPGMGLPLFAGTIKQGIGKIIFDNQSGHYKPTTTAEQAQKLLAEIAPMAKNLNYIPAKGTTHLNEVDRLENISSPEEYVDKVNEFIYHPDRAITYLKEEKDWNEIQKTSYTKALTNIANGGEISGISSLGAAAPYNPNPQFSTKNAFKALDPLSQRLILQKRMGVTATSGSPTAVSRPGFMSRLFGSCKGHR
ncbi:RHS repeat-associated core domain-containing protein [Pseudomonas putida]|uniref:RHS repeat-associated core domain-containing protein n=1 Tax=Pseudomonas putida TaxID=303 RepID=UPI0023672EB3|nr:RHS repeat-associated core domain-containing protein [Pseudomonas putida]MDD2049080.1 RHS repeat protein [Pseudomonas putida]